MTARVPKMYHLGWKPRTGRLRYWGSAAVVRGGEGEWDLVLHGRVAAFGWHVLGHGAEGGGAHGGVGGDAHAERLGGAHCKGG